MVTSLTKVVDVYGTLCIPEENGEERREVQRGVMLIETLHADLLLKVNEEEVQTFGSQGQERSRALRLKLKYRHLIDSAQSDAWGGKFPGLPGESKIDPSVTDKKTVVEVNTS